MTHPEAPRPDGPDDGTSPGPRPMGDQSGGPFPPIARPRPRAVTAPYRPMIFARPLGRMDAFVRLPPATARTAVVIVTARNGPQPIGPDGRPPAMDILRGGGTLYEVDLGLHHTSMEFELPSAADTVTFHAVVEIEWRVGTPEKVVADGLVDVREALTMALGSRLAWITKEIPVGRVLEAQAAVDAELGRSDPGRPYGLRTTVNVRLSADSATTEFEATRRDLTQKLEILALQQELSEKQEAHDQRLLRGRLDTYRSIIAKGDHDRFALQLAQNPEDVRVVVKMLSDERHQDRRQVTDFITTLVQSGAVERWQIEDQVRIALEWLAHSTDRVIHDNVPAEVPLPRAAPPTETIFAEAVPQEVPQPPTA